MAPFSPSTDSDPAHPSHADLKEWAGDYDPDTIDEPSIRARLARIANHRNAGRTRTAKKKPLDSAA